MKKFYSFLFLAVMGLLSFAAGAVNINLHVNDANAISAYYYGYDENYNTVQITFDLVDGDNAISIDAYRYLTVEAKPGYLLQSVTMDGIAQSIYGSSVGISIYDSYEGKTLDVVAVDETTVRTAKLYVTVDDPTQVNAQLAGTYRSVLLQDGENVIAFDPNTEIRINFSNINSQKQLYSVILNDEAQPITSTGCTVNIKDGDRIDVKAKFPEEYYPLIFSLTGEAPADVIKEVRVDGVIVSDYMSADFNVQMGSIVAITLDTENYQLNSVLVNGVEKNSYYISFTMTEETTVAIDAQPYGNICVNVDIDNPEAVTAYYGYAYQNNIATLVSGSQIIELPAKNPVMSFKINNGYYYETFTIDGNAQTDYGYGVTAYLSEGSQVIIRANEISLDKQFVLYIDDKEATSQFNCSDAKRGSYDVETGYNVIYFYDGLNPFQIGWYGNIQFNLYKNGEAVAPTYTNGTYASVTVADGDVLKAYTTAVPESYTATFVATGDDQITVLKDCITLVDDWKNGITDMQGTLIEIGNAQSVKVGDMVLDADEDGSFAFTLNADCTVTINDNVGAELVNKDAKAANTNVYNAQGLLLIKNATPEQINALDKGFYIIGGVKRVVRK